MIRPVVRDPMFLAQKSDLADASDLSAADDLTDTLRAHLDGCVGIAANMIGVQKRIIAFCSGPSILLMLNPRIISRSGPYEAEEGCLSLPGIRKAMRYREIRVSWQDRMFRTHTETFRDFTAQIIQHELDHCDGVLI